MKANLFAKVIFVGALLTLHASMASAQTEQQIADRNLLTESDWTDTLDYSEWLINARFWFEHPDSPYAKEFFAGLNLTSDDDAKLRSVARDFTQRHDQLFAASYAKLETPDWTLGDQTRLVKDLVDATHEAMQRIQSDLTADGAKSVNAAAVGTDPHS